MNEHTDAIELLKTVVERAADRLREGQVPSEKGVEYLVVMPILTSLGWNPQNIDEMYPEYGVENRRVDWAFLSDGKPSLLLEEKAPDQSLSAHENQLLDYAFKEGVRLAILTNGREWWFYLPLEEGPWRERRCLTIDLMNQGADEVALQFADFISKQAVTQGLAYERAKQRYDEAREEQRIKEALPATIRGLLSEPSSQVIEFFQNQTQPAVGTLPPTNLVEDALSALFVGIAIPTSEGPVDTGEAGEARTEGLQLPPLHTRPVSVTIGEQTVPISIWKDVLVETGNWLIENGYQLPFGKKPGYKMEFLSRSQDELKAPKELVNGVYIETWYSARDCVKNARWLLEQLNLPAELLQIEYNET